MKNLISELLFTDFLIVGIVTRHVCPLDTGDCRLFYKDGDGIIQNIEELGESMVHHHTQVVVNGVGKGSMKDISVERPVHSFEQVVEEKGFNAWNQF